MAGWSASYRGLRELIELMGGLDRRMDDALHDELKEATSKAHREIVTSTSPPYRTGFTRKSTGEDPGKGVYSTLAWARIWEFGGVARPNGVAITFPKTQWMSKPMEDAFDDIEDRIADRFDRLV